MVLSPQPLLLWCDSNKTGLKLERGGFQLKSTIPIKSANDVALVGWFAWGSNPSNKNNKKREHFVGAILTWS